MSDTVQIPEDVMQEINDLYVPVSRSDYKTYNDYVLAKSARDELIYAAKVGYRIVQQKIKSFRKKLENITIDELLTNPRMVLDLFDKHFGTPWHLT